LERCNADQYREHLACIAEQKARADRVEAGMVSRINKMKAALEYILECDPSYEDWPLLIESIMRAARAALAESPPRCDIERLT
jgi:hypothetical protein